jgi:hypothetical protein
MAEEKDPTTENIEGVGEIGFKKLRKPRGVLIKFRTMEEILLSHPSWFDQHGNLHVETRGRSAVQSVHLAPIYFQYLGRLKQFDHEVSFDSVFVEKEYMDLFEPNMALRFIASGKYNQEQCVQIAKEGVIVQ